MKEFILDVNIELNKDNQNYPFYFFDHLRSKRVQIVIGGTQYKNEVKSKIKLLMLINDLKDANQARKVDDGQVDDAQETLVQRIHQCIGECPQECDDHHIFALALVSGCLNILTNDHRMARCRGIIRNDVGHNYCPAIRIIPNQLAYDVTPNI